VPATLALVGIWHLADTPLLRLSGGLLRLARLARGLHLSPTVLPADMPTSDPATANPIADQAPANPIADQAPVASRHFRSRRVALLPPAFGCTVMSIPAIGKALAAFTPAPKAFSTVPKAFSTAPRALSQALSALSTALRALSQALRAFSTAFRAFSTAFKALDPAFTSGRAANGG
jgi:hypothetical protein